MNIDMNNLERTAVHDGLSEATCAPDPAPCHTAPRGVPAGGEARAPGLPAEPRKRRAAAAARAGRAGAPRGAGARAGESRGMGGSGRWKNCGLRGYFRVSRCDRFPVQAESPSLRSANPPQARQGEHGSKRPYSPRRRARASAARRRPRRTREARACASGPRRARCLAPRRAGPASTSARAEGWSVGLRCGTPTLS